MLFGLIVHILFSISIFFKMERNIKNNQNYLKEIICMWIHMIKYKKECFLFHINDFRKYSRHGHTTK